jgi:hypothetical protein
MNIRYLLLSALCVASINNIQASCFAFVELRSTQKVDPFIQPLGVANMRKVLAEIDSSLFGKKDKKTGEMIGQYTYQGKRYSVQELAELEATQGSTPEMVALGKEIVNQFIDTTQPFKEDIHAVRAIVLWVIDEWVNIHGLEDSIISEWCNLDIDNEVEYFRNRLQTMGEVYSFLYDVDWFVHNFLGNCTTAIRSYLDTINRPDLYNKFLRFIRS